MSKGWAMLVLLRRGRAKAASAERRTVRRPQTVWQRRHAWGSKRLIHKFIFIGQVLVRHFQCRRHSRGCSQGSPRRTQEQEPSALPSFSLQRREKTYICCLGRSPWPSTAPGPRMPHSGQKGETP